MGSDFDPLSRCHLTDLFELAVMHWQTLHRDYDSGRGPVTTLRVHPTKLRARQGREYLLDHDDAGQPLRSAVEGNVGVRELRGQIGRSG